MCLERRWTGTLLVESQLVLLANVSHPHHAHWGLPNDRTTCDARKRHHQGKTIHESFLLQMIGTGLRRETLSHSDQAPGLDKNTGLTSHRYEGLPHTTNLPIGDSPTDTYLWAVVVVVVVVVFLLLFGGVVFLLLLWVELPVSSLQ